MTNSEDVKNGIDTEHVIRLTAIARHDRNSSVPDSRASVCITINLLCLIKCYINTDNIFLGIKCPKFYVV